jgi:hypothetical protein
MNLMGVKLMFGASPRDSLPPRGRGDEFAASANPLSTPAAFDPAKMASGSSLRVTGVARIEMN